MHTVDASETVGRMVEFFPGVSSRSSARSRRGFSRSRLAAPAPEGRRRPRRGGRGDGQQRARRDLIRDNRADEIHDAIADGSFFDMQTFTQALIELVVAEQVEHDVAANAATNRHDFLVALERSLKTDAAEKRAAEQKAAEPEVPELRLARPAA